MTEQEPNKVGRPLKFESLPELQKAIDAFFHECDVKEDPYTITGLALALDTSRKVLCEYEEREEYSNAIKKAKTRVENFAEKRLYAGAPAGAIFALKNFDWSDKQDVNLGGQKGNPIKTELADQDRAILDHYMKTKGAKSD